MKLLIMQFPPVSSFFHPLKPKYLPQFSILKHHQLMFSPQCEKPSFKPYKTTCKIMVLYSQFIMNRLYTFLAKWWQVYPKFTISSQTIQVPVETVFWWSPASPEYQQWCTLYIQHADKCWWLPGRHHHCQSGSAL